MGSLVENNALQIMMRDGFRIFLHNMLMNLDLIIVHRENKRSKSAPSLRERSFSFEYLEAIGHIACC